MVILAGAEYGSGSSRDSAAKGPMLLVSPSCAANEENLKGNGKHLRTNACDLQFTGRQGCDCQELRADPPEQPGGDGDHPSLLQSR
jgi:hypothetical protein